QAVAIVQRIMSTKRNWVVFMPKALASSSPIANTLIRQRTKKSINSGNPMNKTEYQRSDLETRAKLPISQKTIAGILSKGSAILFIKETSAEKNPPVMIPDNTSVKLEALA